MLRDGVLRAHHLLRALEIETAAFAADLGADPLAAELHALAARCHADAPWGRKLLRRVGPQAGSPALLMDRTYEGDQTRALAEELGYRLVVPPMRTRTQPWDYDRVLYRRRNEVERFFCRLKRFRRIATRYDKLDSVFLAFIHLAFIHLALIYDALQLT